MIYKSFKISVDLVPYDTKHTMKGYGWLSTGNFNILYHIGVLF